MSSRIKILGGSASLKMAKSIARIQDFPFVETKLLKFSDGEMQPEICDSIRGDYVFFIQSTIAPAENMLELLLMIDAAKRASAGYITAVIPYFGYARQDRKDRSRVPIAAKLIANILTASGANRIITMDLHAPQIQGFFDIPVDHLDSSVIFLDYLESLDQSNMIFAAPDVSSTKRARTFGKAFGLDIVICDKRREKANEVAGITLIGDVKGKDVVLVDDIVDTAGTLCSAAKVIMENGAKSIRAICTHPVLSGPAYDRIEASVITELAVCGTIPLQQKSKKIKVLPVEALFATAIKRVIEHRSISSLFMEKEKN